MTVKVARTFEDVRLDTPAMLSIGTFDGVHRGHRFLLEQARNRAIEQQFALVIVTFDPCPAVILRPDVGRYQISTPAQKLQLLDNLDSSLIVLLTFTPQLSRLSAEAFMDELEARLQLRELWVGQDFRFGHDRRGDPDMLAVRSRTSGFSLHVVSRRMDDKESISSSRIRGVIARGDVENATPLLGYPFRRASEGVAAATWISGGDCVSCSIAPHLLLPADGMYAVQTSSGIQTVALVAGSAQKAQLMVKGTEAGSSFEVEFVHWLTTYGEYLHDPARWDVAATTLVSRWQRPTYAPISSH